MKAIRICIKAIIYAFIIIYAQYLCMPDYLWILFMHSFSIIYAFMKTIIYSHLFQITYSPLHKF